MFHLIYSTRKPLQISTTTTKQSTPHYLFLHLLLPQKNPSHLKPISNIPTITPTEIPTSSSSFTLSYLINSCGLSPQTALSASQKIQLKSAKNPDSVLAFFRNHGFTNTQIANMITKWPRSLSSNPDKTLFPKLHFFQGLGIPSPVLAKLFSSAPFLLTRSLQNQIMPYVDFIKTYVRSNENLMTCVHRSTRFLKCDFKKVMEPNIAILHDHGVSEYNISRLITIQPSSLMCNVERFNEIINMIMEMGFDPSAGNFILAIRVISTLSKSKWQEKVNVYRTLGWSEDEFLLAFKYQPNLMMTSEKKIKRMMSFFMDEMDWKPSDLARYPSVLLFSLEKRIVPRCSVLRILLSKDLIHKYSTVKKALTISEKDFCEKFMGKYQERVPEILTVYRGTMGFIGLDLKSKDAGGALKL